MKTLVTGGAGYIGSALVAALLERGDQVTVLDDLWFGGDSLVPFLSFDSFRLIKRDLCGQLAVADAFDGVDSVVHLAAVVGFPACKQAGRELVWRTNVEGTRRAYEAAVKAGVRCLIFASSYSSYGESKQGEPVTEESPLNPQSLYAESKIEAERFLLGQADLGGTAPICLRLATVFGVSPRTRFDLMVNQFVLDAHTKERLTLYQEDFKRSFVHVRDVARAIMCAMDAPNEQVRGQVFNVGSETLNTSKQELAKLIQARVPRLKVEYSGASFAGDMRSIHVSFDKMRRTLQFEARISLEEGIEELLWTLRNGIISDPLSGRFRNHPAMLM
jgi:nucleoside-diphosphate-sugar epimerase